MCVGAIRVGRVEIVMKAKLRLSRAERGVSGKRCVLAQLGRAGANRRIGAFRYARAFGQRSRLGDARGGRVEIVVIRARTWA